MSAVPTRFVDDLAEALEHLAAQARDATGRTPMADVVLDALACHLRAVARTAGDAKVNDWRLGLLRSALDPSRGVTLASGTLGFHLRRLAITPDDRDQSLDRLINGLAVVAVEERLKADAVRIDAAETSASRLSLSESHAADELTPLQERAAELAARVAALEEELGDERKRVEFLRGYVSGDIAAESEAKRPASDNKTRVDTGIYRRQRADGTDAYQVVGTKTRPGQTFDDLQAAVSYRDGTGSAATGSERDASAEPAPSDPAAGPDADREQVPA